ncbi:MAG: carboxylesterase family protein [Desulfobacterota bacterium]|nr:carboxylesterase family protein [Thermodesulfobacteriota bacterium]
MKGIKIRFRAGRYLCVSFVMVVVSSALLNTVCYADTSLWSGDPLVTTLYGRVQGFEDNASTFVWKAIPYAKPPVGAMRWKAPQNPEPWSGIREENDFCSMCPQFGSIVIAGAQQGAIIGNEDCLYLNIWRPRSAQRNLPVFFWIHGGSNVQGSANPYSGTEIASRGNMVVVTINYRLGIFGWLTHPALREGADDFTASGNYGTLDIIKALAWVRDNIAAFGGDPNNVTIAGQSAGGINTLSLLISPVAKGLFHRVISQSGGLQPVSVQDGDAYTEQILKALLVKDGTPEDKADEVIAGMSNVEIKSYLYGKTTQELFEAIKGLRAGPTVFKDGVVLQSDGADALNDPEKYNQVPVIIGSTAEEGKLFMYLSGLHETWGPMLYQAIGRRASQIARILSLDEIANRLAAHPTQPGVYCYVFQFGMFRHCGYNAWPVDEGPNSRMSWAVALGSFHGLDIPFTFGLVKRFPLFFSIADKLFREDNRAGYEALSNAIMDYFAAFARTGIPHPEGMPEWTKWPGRQGMQKERFMLFDANDREAVLRMGYEAR